MKNYQQKDPYDESYFQKNPGMQNICKSVHLDFNDTVMSDDELEGFFFGLDESTFDQSAFEFPDYKNDSLLTKKSPEVDIHIGKISSYEAPWYEFGTASCSNV